MPDKPLLKMKYFDVGIPLVSISVQYICWLTWTCLFTYNWEAEISIFGLIRMAAVTSSVILDYSFRKQLLKIVEDRVHMIYKLG